MTSHDFTLRLSFRIHERIRLTSLMHFSKRVATMR
jgi:hypothetical protein